MAACGAPPCTAPTLTLTLTLTLTQTLTLTHNPDPDPSLRGGRVPRPAHYRRVALGLVRVRLRVRV